MTDLKWIPMPYDRRLPLGFYWLLEQDGETRSFCVGISGCEFYHSVTHYCPIPKPTLPEPEPQDCPFCGNESKLTYTSDAHYIYVACLMPSCALVGPTRDTEAEAIAAWNRITLRDPKPEEPHDSDHRD